MKSIPQQVSKSVRERNPSLYGAQDVATIGFEMLAQSSTPPPKRIRQSTKPLMNKLESEWLERQKAFFPSYEFHAQSIRFKLGNGIWYKPDAVCFNFYDVVACWEVKGPHSFRGGMENLKVAAHQYPQIKWTLVWKQDGKWQEQVVLP